MIRNFYKWNEKNFSDGFSVAHVLKHGRAHQEDKRIVLRVGDEIYHFKTPHSRYFKNHETYFSGEEALVDNSLSASTELLSERRYRAFKFPYAHYETLKNNKGITLVSKDIQNDDIELRSLGDLATYEDTYFSKYAKRLMTQTLVSVIKDSRIPLKIMTPECYDQFIKFHLASIFDFSNDDHFNNIIFMRNQNSGLFESMFLCDKESNIFNPDLASGTETSQAYDYAKRHMEYHGMHMCLLYESFPIRVRAIRQLILDGEMPKEYIKFLRKIADYDQSGAVKDIYDKFNIVVDERQLEIYKKAQEVAGSITERGK